MNGKPGQLFGEEGSWVKHGTGIARDAVTSSTYIQYGSLVAASAPPRNFDGMTSARKTTWNWKVESGDTFPASFGSCLVPCPSPPHVPDSDSSFVFYTGSYRSCGEEKDPNVAELLGARLCLGVRDGKTRIQNALEKAGKTRDHAQLHVPIWNPNDAVCQQSFEDRSGRIPPSDRMTIISMTCCVIGILNRMDVSREEVGVGSTSHASEALKDNHDCTWLYW
ncbi:uncharacterized protein MYCFIDRAFT_170240 [Pseudocercospora fijiensis CIRAD86]|uniref:Uncharacterized protein n=1 Tax=Pseudocercospora fijiensis (strain CIRAD86) TaxID=383855 RepID=N1Q7J8_PSEFD|nr:uncharacterized protein MYCFIDRAFT_170240 [Pseudocercospora fijiensis CIRAD86]EME88649.1 hypothetical protein MYCFIDRAFT_170240 [Pseudocercospora fijiensis CIRAD86]